MHYECRQHHPTRLGVRCYLSRDHSAPHTASDQGKYVVWPRLSTVQAAKPALFKFDILTKYGYMEGAAQYQVTTVEADTAKEALKLYATKYLILSGRKTVVAVAQRAFADDRFTGPFRAATPPASEWGIGDYWQGK